MPFIKDGFSKDPGADLSSDAILAAFSGTPDGTKFLRDDGTLAVPSGGGGSVAIADITDWPAGVSDIEVGYLDGVTSAIQTQLAARIAASTLTTNGDLLTRTAGVPARLGLGTALQYLRTNSGATALEFATLSALQAGVAIATTATAGNSVRNIHTGNDAENYVVNVPTNGYHEWTVNGVRKALFGYDGTFKWCMGDYAANADCTIAEYLGSTYYDVWAGGVHRFRSSQSDILKISAGTIEVQSACFLKFLTALGGVSGGSAASLSATPIGQTGQPTTGHTGWLKILDSSGATRYVPTFT